LWLSFFLVAADARGESKMIRKDPKELKLRKLWESGKELLCAGLAKKRGGALFPKHLRKCVAKEMVSVR
jgi:hypothetical protein